MGFLSRNKESGVGSSTSDHRYPLGCLGAAEEIIFYGAESDRAFLGREPRDDSVEDAHAYTAFGCEGLRQLGKLNRTVLDGYYKPGADRAGLEQVHVREAKAFIASACATCDFGPAAKLREATAIRKAEHEIRLAELEVRRLELLVQLGQQAVDPSSELQLGSPQMEASSPPQ